MPAIARLGDTSSHDGVIITASSDVRANGVGVARIGDQHSCPIPGHGVTSIITGSAVTRANGSGVARIGDAAGCGAIINTGSPSVNSG